MNGDNGTPERKLDLTDGGRLSQRLVDLLEGELNFEEVSLQLWQEKNSNPKGEGEYLSPQQVIDERARIRRKKDAFRTGPGSPGFEDRMKAQQKKNQEENIKAVIFLVAFAILIAAVMLGAFGTSGGGGGGCYDSTPGFAGGNYCD